MLTVNLTEVGEVHEVGDCMGGLPQREASLRLRRLAEGDGGGTEVLVEVVAVKSARS